MSRRRDPLLHLSPQQSAVAVAPAPPAPHHLVLTPTSSSSRPMSVAVAPPVNGVSHSSPRTAPPQPNGAPLSSIQKLAQANESTWLLIGAVAEQMGDLERSQSAYENALRHNALSVNALMQLAGIARIKENYTKAVDYFQRVVNHQSDHGEAWSAIGHCYLMQDELQKAYTAYQQALYWLPNPKEDPKLWYGIGILYDRYGSLDHAEEAFASVLRMDRDFDKANEILFRLGIIYKQQCKYQQSLDCFERILRSPPNPLAHVDIWFQMGHVYEQQKDYIRAKEAYERVVQDKPHHAKVLQQLGWLYHQSDAPFQNQELAIQYLTKSLEVDPGDAQSWYLLGRAYMAGQKYNKAYEAYQQAVYRDGRNPTFWCSIGVLYFQINQYRDALDAYSRAIRINPYISEVWFDLGSLYESCNNQISDAIDAYARAAELDPANKVIAHRLQLLKKAQATGSSVPAAPGPQDVHPTAYAASAHTGPPASMHSQGPPAPLMFGQRSIFTGPESSTRSGSPFSMGPPPVGGFQGSPAVSGSAAPGPGGPGPFRASPTGVTGSRTGSPPLPPSGPPPPSYSSVPPPGSAGSLPFRGGAPPPLVLDESHAPPRGVHTPLAPMDVDRGDRPLRSASVVGGRSAAPPQREERVVNGSGGAGDPAVVLHHPQPQYEGGGTGQRSPSSVRSGESREKEREHREREHREREREREREYGYRAGWESRPLPPPSPAPRGVTSSSTAAGLPPPSNPYMRNAAPSGGYPPTSTYSRARSRSTDEPPHPPHPPHPPMPTGAPPGGPYHRIDHLALMSEREREQQQQQLPERERGRSRYVFDEPMEKRDAMREREEWRVNQWREVEEREREREHREREEWRGGDERKYIPPGAGPGDLPAGPTAAIGSIPTGRSGVLGLSSLPPPPQPNISSFTARAHASESPAPEKEVKEPTGGGRRRKRGGNANVVKDEDGASSGVETAKPPPPKRKRNPPAKRGSTTGSVGVPEEGMGNGNGGKKVPATSFWAESAGYQRPVDEDYDEGVDALMGLASSGGGNGYRPPLAPPGQQLAPIQTGASMPPPPRPPSRPVSRASTSSHRSLSASHVVPGPPPLPPSAGRIGSPTTNFTHSLKRPHSSSGGSNESHGGKRARIDLDNPAPPPPSLSGHVHVHGPPHPPPERRASGSHHSHSPKSARSGQGSPRALGGGESMRLPPIITPTPPKSPTQSEGGGGGVDERSRSGGSGRSSPGEERMQLDSVSPAPGPSGASAAAAASAGDVKIDVDERERSSAGGSPRSKA